MKESIAFFKTERVLKEFDNAVVYFTDKESSKLINIKKQSEDYT